MASHIGGLKDVGTFYAGILLKWKSILSFLIQNVMILHMGAAEYFDLFRALFTGSGVLYLSLRDFRCCM